MKRPLAITLVVTTLASVCWLVLGLHSVPEGAVAVVDSRMRPPRIAGPGWCFAPFGLTTLTRLDPFVRDADLPYKTPEGAVLDMRIRVGLQLTVPGANALLASGRGASALQRLGNAIDQVVTERIRESVPDGSIPGLDEALWDDVRRALGAYGELEGDFVLAYREDSPVTLALRQAELIDQVRALRHDTGARIVIVGWDGADWQIAEPLIERGRLPHLAGLRRRGAWGNVRSLTPMLSPLLWTSVATGVTADRHGVLDFLIRDAASGVSVPVSSRFRRVRALWNLFTDAGLASDVVAWWATWPSEPVNGHVVSDRVAYSLFDFALPTGADGATYPEGYFEEIRPLLVNDDDVTYEDVTRFVTISRDEYAEARARISEDRQAAYRQPVNHLTKVLASTRNYHRIVLDLIAREQADLTMVYYQGIDEIGHRFMHFMPPRMDGIDPADVARYGRAVEEFYVYQDELLGELLARLAPDSTVLLLSDHGFQNGADRPRGQTADIEGQPGRWHRAFGMLVLAGPPIAAGRLDTTSLLDVAPTVLSLAGLPSADDMDGRVLDEALLPAFRRRFPPARIASYEVTPFRVAAAPRSEAIAAAEAEIVENLRSLGYVGSTTPLPGTAEDISAVEAGSGTAMLTTHTNLAAVLLASGDLEGAEQEILAALRMHPRYPVARRQLFSVRVRQQRYQDALEIAEELLTEGDELDDRFLARLADTYSAAGRTDEGIRVFGRAVERGDWRAGSALARLLLEAGDPRRADAVARAVLARQPRNLAAMVTVFRVAQSTGNLQALRPSLDEALRLNPRSVMHLNWLAIVEESGGDIERAESLLRRALEADPDHGGSMANLGAFYSRHGRGEEAVELLRRALRIDPGNVDARINLGSALARLERFDEALIEFESVVQQGHHRADIYNAIARIHALRNDLQAARKWLRGSIELEPGQEDVLRALERIEPDQRRHASSK